MHSTIITTNITANDGQVFSVSAGYYKGKQKAPRALLFCLPGGGTTRGFFDLAPKHSFAVRMTGKGYDILTMDHPGTASNPLPASHPFLTPWHSAAYLNDALSRFIATLEYQSPIVGVGHSMGGMIMTMMQAKEKPFCGVALLGSNAGGLDWALDDHEKTYIDRQEEFTRDLEELTLRKFKAEFIPGMGGPSGKTITFGGATGTLNECLRHLGCELFSAGGLTSMTRGSFRMEVEAIDVPMFFAFGDHDIGIPPEEAPKDYVGAPSHDLVILENTGHNSLAFSSIGTLCEKLDQWIQTGAHSPSSREAWKGARS